MSILYNTTLQKHMIQGKRVLKNFSICRYNLIEMVNKGLQPYYWWSFKSPEPIPAPDYQEFLELNKQYESYMATGGMTSYAFSDELCPFSETPSQVKKRSEAAKALVLSRLPNAKKDSDYYNWKNYWPGNREQLKAVHNILKDALFFEYEVLKNYYLPLRSYREDIVCSDILQKQWKKHLEAYKNYILSGKTVVDLYKKDGISNLTPLSFFSDRFCDLKRKHNHPHQIEWEKERMRETFDLYSVLYGEERYANLTTY